MRNFFESLRDGLAFTIGIILAILIFGKIFNSLERYMLSQNCDNYFDKLYEENLVPNRCYFEETQE